MTGEKYIKCRCGKRWSVSSLRNSDNEFICPDCEKKQAEIMRKHKPINPKNYQVMVVTFSGSMWFCPISGGKAHCQDA